MFEVPEAKRVRRSKFFNQFPSVSTSGSEEDIPDDGQMHHTEDDNSTKADRRDPKDRADLAAHDHDDQIKINYGFEHDYIDMAGPSDSTIKLSQQKDQPSKVNNDEAREQEDATSKEQTYEFFLFKPKQKRATTDPSNDTALSQKVPDPKSDINAPIRKTQTNTANKITIRSPTPESQRSNTSGAILKPRPQTYYFTSLTTPAAQANLKAQYTKTALSGSDIESLASQAWPGTALPWRVIHSTQARVPQHHPSNGPSKDMHTGTLTQEDPHLHRHLHRQRTRPSKKRRILMRQRLALRLSQQALASQTAEMAEQADREKRTRRNREKKVKRKMREKMKKEKVEMTEDQALHDGSGGVVGDARINDVGGAGDEVD